MNLLKRTYQLLQPGERKESVRVVMAVFLMALLNFVGIATLLPILYLLLEKEGERRMVLLFCLLAFVVVVLKSLMSFRLLRVIHSFLLELYKRLSLALYASYYRRGLLFVRERGANRLAFEVNNVCFHFSQGVLMPILHMTADGMLLLLVTVAFLIYDGATMLLLYVSFIPFVIGYLLVFRKRISGYGEEEQQARREQTQVVVDTFRGYAEAEVYGAFPRLWQQFEDGANLVSVNRMQMMKLQRIPMLLSELSVVIGLALLSFTGKGDISLITGAFALAALKLLPALRSLLSGWTQIKHASYCMDVIEEGLAAVKEMPAEAGTEVLLPFEREIVVKDVSYAYEDGRDVIVNFNCRIAKGEMVGFRGQSGVGKSTLFNLLLGFFQPSSGSMEVDGVSLSASPQQAWLRRIGYVPQEVFVFDATLAENVALGAENIDEERLMSVLQQVALDDWVKELPRGIKTRLNENGTRLSGGQKQRLGMARALYKNADVLFLDEAASSLDKDTEKEINDTIARLRKKHKGMTILYIAHHESALAACDRVIEVKGL